MLLFRNLHYLCLMMLLNFLWIFTCSNMPYWQKISTSTIIDFSLVDEIVSENKTFTINSINIGSMHSCLDKLYCFRNQQLRKVLLLPSDRADLVIFYGLLGASIAYCFSCILLCYTHHSIFFLLTVSLWTSFILLFIGFVEVQRALTFNNWASWGYFIGTIFMFILAIEVINIWYEYNKSKKRHDTNDLTATK